MLSGSIIFSVFPKACGGLSAPSPSAGPTEDTEQVIEPTEEAVQDKDASPGFPDSQDEEEASEGSNKFYCYLCSITCFNQQVGGMHTQH